MEKDFCIKIHSNIENTIKKLEKKGIKFDKLEYLLDIYMIQANKSIFNLQKIEELEDYAVIEDYNNEEKRIKLKELGSTRGIIRGVSSTKSLLEKLGYVELMYINKDMYYFNIQEINAKFEICDVKNHGVFIHFLLDDNSDIPSYIKTISKYLYRLDLSNIHVDIKLLEFNRVKEKR